MTFCLFPAARGRRRPFAPLKPPFKPEPALPSGECHRLAQGYKMEVPEFPIEKKDPRQAELSTRTEPRPVVRKYVEPPETGAPAAQSYDSLLDYWHILFRHRLTLLVFALAGLSAAILISLVQTPIYRVRTSLEIQSASFLEIKGADAPNSSGNYASPESYVETQVKLLQSESLIEHVIDKMKLHRERPTTAWGYFASGVHGLFSFSGTTRLPEREQLIRQ